MYPSCRWLVHIIILSKEIKLTSLYSKNSLPHKTHPKDSFILILRYQSKLRKRERMENTEKGVLDIENEEKPSKLVERKKKEEQEEETEEEELLSVERIFEKKEVPSWRKQLTIRAFVVSFFMSIMFSFIVMKLNLTTGIIPSLNVSAGLLGFFFVKTWTKLLENSGMLKQPFTRQENTVIQTCVVASSGIAFSGMCVFF